MITSIKVEDWYKIKSKVWLIVINFIFAILLFSCSPKTKEIAKEKEAEMGKELAEVLFDDISSRNYNNIFENADSLAKIYFEKDALKTFFEIEKDLYGSFKSFEILQKLDTSQVPCTKQGCHYLCFPANIQGMYMSVSNFRSFLIPCKVYYEKATVIYPIGFISRKGKDFKLACIESFCEKGKTSTKIFDIGKQIIKNIEIENYDELYLFASNNLRNRIKKYKFEDLLHDKFAPFRNKGKIQFSPYWHRVSMGFLVEKEKTKTIALLKLVYKVSNDRYINITFEKENGQYLLGEISVLGEYLF